MGEKRGKACATATVFSPDVQCTPFARARTMSLAGLPARGSAQISLPDALRASVAASVVIVREHERATRDDLCVHTPYGGASAVAFHHTSLFTRAAAAHLHVTLPNGHQ